MDRANEKSERRERRNLEWVLEVVLLVIVAPAIYFGIASIGAIPLA